MKQKQTLITVLMLMLVLSSCSKNGSSQNEKLNTIPQTIKEIAYDFDNSWGNRIYLLEDGKYTPFIVLSSNYNSNCLVMREYLLEEAIAYNTAGEYGSYYKDSIVDQFLSDTYYSMLSDSLKDVIVDSEIMITTKNAIDTHADETEMVTRKIFLLSANEVNASLGSLTVKEGDVISYFKAVKNRIALYETLEAGTWMLRTPALSGGNTVVGVGDDGSIGMGGINGMDGLSENALRPVFCVPLETPILQSEDIIEGQSVFYIQ